MSEVNKNFDNYWVGFIKHYRFFFIKSLILLMFLFECFIVRNFALKQIIWLVIITLVNFYICERKFRIDEEAIKYFNLVFFFSGWVALLLFFFWGFLYYYALAFPLIELSTKIQAGVVLALNARTLIQLACNIIVLLLTISVNLEPKIRNLEPDPDEGRFSRRVREKVVAQMWFFKYPELFGLYTGLWWGLFNAVGWSRKLRIKIFPPLIERQLLWIMSICYVLFVLWTIFKILYIVIKTVRKEYNMAARKNNKHVFMRKALVTAVKTKALDYGKKVNTAKLKKSAVAGMGVLGAAWGVHYAYNSADNYFYPAPAGALENDVQIQKDLAEVKARLAQLAQLLEEKKDNG